MSQAATISPWRLAPHVSEARYDLLATLRQPSFAVPTLLFPAMFYLFFGVVFGSQNGLASYLVPTYGVFGVVGATLFGFGVSIAMARESGELRLKRVSPMPLTAFFAAKVTTSMVFSVLILAELFTLAAVFGGVRFERGQWIAMAAVLLAGSIPFAALGLAIGSYTSGNGAPALINMIYLPSAFLSGLWIPIEVLPQIMAKIALFLPTYHFAQLALHMIGKGVGQPIALHVAVLIATTLISLAFAVHGFRREEN